MKAKNGIRRRQKAIKELISSRAIEDQQELVELIKQEYGLETNQAAISRDLKQLGIIKRPVKGKMIYEPSMVNVAQEILRLAIIDIRHNESMIVVETIPGLPDFVGDYLDMQDSEGVLGTLAGENVVFVSPESTKKIKYVYKKICKALYFKPTKED